MDGHHGQFLYLAQHLTDHVYVWYGATRSLLSGTTSLNSRPHPSYLTSTCHKPQTSISHYHLLGEKRTKNRELPAWATGNSAPAPHSTCLRRP
jgi:hypothetical protein